MVFKKEKYLVIYVIIEYLIKVCSSHADFTSGLVNSCSKWHISSKQVIYGYENVTTINDSLSLNLFHSGLDINGQTDEIAVLDDLNHRVLIINQSNTSILTAILSDSSNITNTSIFYSPSAIVYDENNSLHILDSWNQQIIQMQNPLEYGDNATLTNKSIPLPYNGTLVGLCVDPTNQDIFISDQFHHQIIRYGSTTPNISIYVGNGTQGDTSYLLHKPGSIVMNNNRTLFVNDQGNDRIQMFPFNSKNGTTLPTNISGCTGLSLYSFDILVITTPTTVYLFNLTNNQTKCAIGCHNATKLNISHNAVIDNNGSLIVTVSNQIISYPMYQKCSDIDMTTAELINELTSTATATTGIYLPGFVPINNCNPGYFGINCSSHDNICDLNRPCFNSGTCNLSSTNPKGYSCQCQWGFYGNNCEDDQRPCKPYTCKPQGTCVNTSLTDFNCICNIGYEGQQCERMINLCVNVTCENSGVCAALLLNYTCKCLTGFSGRLCEITSASTVARAYASKSFAYVAIIMLLLLIGFIVSMDLLKYVFGIDPAKANLDTIRKEKMMKRKKKKLERAKIAYRFQYVN